MRKIVILLLCCGMIVSTVGCGSNTAPPPTENPPTTLPKTIITEVPIETIPPVTALEPTEEEKEPVSTESKDQATEQTVTATEPTEKTSPTVTANLTVKNTAEEKVTPPIEETAPNTTPQLAEKETTETEPPKVTKPESTEKPIHFNIDHWITFAKEYAVSIGLALDSAAVDCWDNPIRAGAHCIYLERDIQSRLKRYAKDEDITDVWIWAESTGNNCYDIYIGYA